MATEESSTNITINDDSTDHENQTSATNTHIGKLFILCKITNEKNEKEKRKKEINIQTNKQAKTN